MTNILVTGGAGFVGSHTVDRLIDEGHQVTVLDNLNEQVHDDKPEYLNNEADYVWGDIRNRELLADIMTEVDMVSHQASMVGVGQSMYEIEEYVEVNTLGTARLLDVVINEDVDIKKFVIASSMSIYGEGAYFCEVCDETKYPGIRKGPQLERGEWELQCTECGCELIPQHTTEDNPPVSNSIYAITKRDQEQMTLTTTRAYDFSAVALRYFNIYGSRQALGNPYTGVCAIFSSRIKNDHPPVIFEDGQQTRDFVHVSDVARANQLAIETNRADGEAINIGTGNSTTINEVAETLIKLYGKDEKLEPEIVEEFRQGDIRHCYADITRAREQLNFEPQIGLEEGMKELISWGRDQAAEDRFEMAYEELKNKGLVDE